MRWRIGRKVPRNIYRDDEPIAMLATPEIAKEIVDGMNEVERLRAGSAAPEESPPQPVDTTKPMRNITSAKSEEK